MAKLINFPFKAKSTSPYVVINVEHTRKNFNLVPKQHSAIRLKNESN